MLKCLTAVSKEGKMLIWFPNAYPGIDDHIIYVGPSHGPCAAYLVTNYRLIHGTFSHVPSRRMNFKDIKGCFSC